MEEEEKLFEEKQSSHISYNDYQKKVTGKSSDGIAIFASAFFILLLLFLGIAKQISPEVDVSIGNDENSNSESIGVEKSAIDERLKLLQMEDEGKNDIFAAELEEKVVIPSDNKKKIKEEESFEENKEEIKAEREANPKPEATSAPEPKIVTPPAAPQGTASKVVVGYYSTKEQAEVAKDIIAESGLNISPFVRAIGGAYTIQVGSYSSREKAQNVANELLRNNYPARIITE